MMNKNIKQVLTLVMSMFLTTSYFSQSYKFLYEMSWKPSKTSIAYNKELTSLTFDENNNSYFQAYDNFRKDSLKTKIIIDYEKSQVKGSLRIPSSDRDAKFRSLIIKRNAEKDVIQEETFFTKTFSIRFPCKIVWNLKNEKPTEKIMGYDVKKATCNFGGRKWIAFYTSEIPIQDGPYKFSGLPGLILKILDSKEDYIFEIKGITKEVNDLKYRNFGNGKPVELSPVRWETFLKKYKEQPSMILENLNTTQTTYVINGKDVSSRDVKDEYNKKEWLAFKNFENPIEVEPSCK
ncbi:GLPGLI family protein [Cruoricaptor ignavus]|nr:GLPGLI family protein [Cruoricaptor ignavus]